MSIISLLTKINFLNACHTHRNIYINIYAFVLFFSFPFYYRYEKINLHFFSTNAKAFHKMRGILLYKAIADNVKGQIFNGLGSFRDI